MRFNADGNPNMDVGHVELHPQPGHKSYINLCNSFYEVRAINGIRQVMCNGEWVNYSDFVDQLFKDDKIDEIAELIEAAGAKPSDTKTA
jgi:hypothetical protein